MDAAAYDYHLPPDRIAQVPVEPRDSARLLVVDRGRGRLLDRRFSDLPDLLEPGDLLVANDSRVLHARLRGRKLSGGAVEALLLRQAGPLVWEALVRGRVREGSVLDLGAADAAVRARVVRTGPDGVRLLEFEVDPSEVLDRLGEVPLPPYIGTPLRDPERYQTVYARVAGSAAAPTAGLHFTPELLSRLARAGVGIAFVTLHVGVDTFRPIEAARVAEHPIHREWASLPAETADAARATRAAGHRVVAVGTTAVRVLETAGRSGVVAPFEGWTDLYILPGHRFGAVDAMITNFHLPRTTLLVLVAAFAGKELLDRAYTAAIERGYRFYSFGDAMLIR